MGKRILAQRMGSSPVYRASTHKSVAPAAIPLFNEPTTATVIELSHNPGRGTPMAKLKTPDGVEFYIHAVEGMYVGHGGKYGRASGTYVQVIGRTRDGVEVKLPSGKSKVLNPNCRAVIGVVAGGGRTPRVAKDGRASEAWR